jgi:hypothetical protein
MEKKLPKVFFEQMPIKLETNMFSAFLGGDWSSMITKLYPDFIPALNIEDKDKRADIIEKTILDIRKQLKQKLDDSLLTIKNDWLKIDKKYLLEISRIMEEEWNDRNIIGYISINPINPRFLESWSFSVNAFTKYCNLIIAHEISHFLFFKKFEKLFPNISKENYNFPNKEWLFSEFVTPIVLNDIRIRKILDGRSEFYPEHKDYKVDGVLVTKILSDLYNKLVIKDNNFDEFVREGLEIVYKIKF